MSDDHLLGLSEVAELLGTSRQAVGNWRQRGHGSFAQPIAELKSGPIWRHDDIVGWANANGKALADVGSGNGVAPPKRAGATVALMNMKGGVGKSTATYNLGYLGA